MVFKFAETKDYHALTNGKTLKIPVSKQNFKFYGVS